MLYTLKLLVQLSHSVMFDYLRPQGLQYARLPCPSSTPRAYSSGWCNPTISSSAIPFSSCLQSYPASESFPVSQFFTSGHQSIEALAPESVLLMTIQNWFDWFDLPEVQGIPRIFSNTTVQKQQFFDAQLSLWSNFHIHTEVLEKTTALTKWVFIGKVMSLLFNMLSNFVIAFLPRSKHLLISWLQSPSAVISVQFSSVQWLSRVWIFVTP